MKAVLVVFAVALAATYAADDLVGGLRVRYASEWKKAGDTGLGKNYFIDIPRTLKDAKAKGWTQQRKPHTPHLPSLKKLYCPKLEVVCTLYDDTGYIGGIQMAVSKDNFTSSPYDLVEMGWTEWKPSSGNVFWTAHIYFVTEEFLKTSKRSRVARRNPNKMLQMDSVWITDIHRTLAEVPRSIELLSADYSKQSCVPAMGTHYFNFHFNQTSMDVCGDTTLPAYFPMYHDGYLTAMALSIFGKMEPVNGVFDWFERFPPAALAGVFSNAPECMLNLAKNQGFLSAHIYFINDPQTIPCAVSPFQ